MKSPGSEGVSPSRSPKPGPQIREGFSLFETIIALFILGVFAAVLGVSFIGVIPRIRLQHAVWEVNAHLNYARFTSVFLRTKARVSLREDRIIVERFLADSKTWRTDRLNLIEGVSLRANNRPVFYPNGNVGGLASILIANAAGAYKITIAISGRIKIVEME